MMHWLSRRVALAVFVFVLALMSAISLIAGPVSRAQVWCPVGWYYNNYTRSCQPVPGPTVTACVTATGRRGFVSGGVCIGN